VAYTYEPNRNLKTIVFKQRNTGIGWEDVSRYDYRYDALARRTYVVNTGRPLQNMSSASGSIIHVLKSWVRVATSDASVPRSTIPPSNIASRRYPDLPLKKFPANETSSK
jgi:hypothetical protein